MQTEISICYIYELVICDIKCPKPMLHSYGFCSCYCMAASGNLLPIPSLFSLFASSTPSVGPTLDYRVLDCDREDLHDKVKF